ncbi:MAG: amino acid adenylation domain-containing protein, partial [bacterium]|nr:amino acid adenylation domain-containing protein [bacterium]
LNGGQVVFSPTEVILDAGSLGKVLVDYQINMLWLTSALFNQLALEDSSIFSPLDYLMVGGDVVPHGAVKKVQGQHRHRDKPLNIMNGYGPTENTTFSTTYLIPGPVDGPIPIGKPVNNSSIFILSPSGQLQPIGIAGELYAGGDGVARGYLNQPELTNKKFCGVQGHVSRHFKKAPGRRRQVLYKIGDLGYWMPDGNIRFLGRIDQQVKIRGFRIEPEEIGQQLMKHPGLEEAVVLALGEQVDEKYLCAYVIATDTKKNAPEPDELKEFLSHTLPEYMIPSFYITIDEIPLTANDKVDKRALPRPDKDSLQRDTVYIAPRDSLEEKLAALWEEVLAIKPVGIKDNFFDLGGHSLKATRMVSRIHRDLQVKLPLHELFTHPTIDELARRIRSKETSRFQSIQPVPDAPDYPLSHAQLRLWILNRVEQGDGGSVAYNIPGGLFLEGELDKEALEGAFVHLLQRHQTLRTVMVIPGESGPPRQKIYPANGLRVGEKPVLQFMDFSAEPDPEEKTLHLARQDARTPFDLSKGPLIRAMSVKTAPLRQALILNMHHIISDGWSMGVIVNELSRLYNSLHSKKGQGNIEPVRDGMEPLRVQYRDYAAWQNQYLEEGSGDRHQRFWHEIYSNSDDIPLLELPTDFPRPAQKTTTGDYLSIDLTPDTAERFRVFNREQGTSPFMTLLAIVNVLLHRYTYPGATDIVLGSPVAGRNHAELEELIGFFVNTLALRFHLEPQAPFGSFLQQVKGTVTESFEHQDYPFDRLVDELNLKRDLSRSPLFDVMVILQNNEAGELSMEGLTAHPFEAESMSYGISKFDLTFSFVSDDEGMGMGIEYNTRLFKKERISRMGHHFQRLLNSIMTKPGEPLHQLEIIGQAEREELLMSFNDTSFDHPLDQTIMDLFEQQVEKTPQHIAVIDATGVSVTYDELNNQADRLVLVLRQEGVQPGDIVAIMMERCIEMMVGIFAILKAGAVYLPVDPGYPGERVNYMLKDSGAKILLSNEMLKGIPGKGEHKNQTEPYQSNRMATSSDLAYIIYTSGSTGKPKGAMIEHRSLLNRILWMHRRYPISTGDMILQKTPVSFDVSLWELFWWSICGASLCLLNPGGERVPDHIIRAVEFHRVTVMHFVPSMLNAFLSVLETVGGVDRLASLKRVFASGEALTASQVNRFNRLLHEPYGVTLHNLYGPTEAAVDVSWFDCSPFDGDDEAVIPIGKPIHNIKLHILDCNYQLQPVGIPGELCISGVGVGRGYLNRPKLTAEKFFIDKSFTGVRGAVFQKRPPAVKAVGDKIYRTGDLARWMFDGNIRFLGRIDDQVKVRGFRIEPGEIENRLTAYPEVAQAVVIVSDSQ